MARELRDYQQQGLAAIRQSLLQGVRRLMVQAPTGSGKTRIAAEIANGAMRKGNRLAFVVPRIDLVDQTLEEFAQEGVTEVGVVQAEHRLTDWSKPIQVCSIQSIRSKQKYPDARVVVFDEAHTMHVEHVKWMQHPEWAHVPFLGLSATPWARGLGSLFDSLLVMATTKELIERGYLSKYKVFAASHPDLEGVKVLADDYQQGQLSEVMREQGTLMADIINSWVKHWNQDKTLVFAVDRAHAKALQQRFLDAGISCGYQDMRTPQSERAQIKREFHSGGLRVVCNVDTLTLGVDWDVRCLSLCRPTRSEIRYVQILGRALRPADGKPHALILDHSDTTQRLGFVDDVHHEHLKGGQLPEKAERRKPLPKECPQCTSLMRPVDGKCPNCGNVCKPTTSGIIEAEGELVEWIGGSRRAAPKPVYSLHEKALWLAQLKWYAADRGWKEGWAMNAYREKFGCWPDWSIKHVDSQPVQMLVRTFIQAKMIRYARSRGLQ